VISNTEDFPVSRESPEKTVLLGLLGLLVPMVKTAPLDPSGLRGLWVQLDLAVPLVKPELLAKTV